MNNTETKSRVRDYLDRLFPQFEEALKETLADNCVIRTFEPGDELMHTGQYFRSTFLIAEGLVKLYREDEEGREFFIYHLSPGNACALSIVCAARQEKSVVMAKAVEATTALLIPIALMDNLAQQYRSWYYFILETYRTRFGELLEVIDSIAFKSMDERLEFYLKNHAKQHNTTELNLTHQQIADDLNSSREVISRLLKKMEQRGILRVGRNVISLL